MLLLGMMFGMFSTSCQDMLSPNSERHAYTVAEDTLYSYWGILKSLQNIAERYVILNECRGDLVDASGFVSDSIGAIVNFGDVAKPDEFWKDGACAYLKIADYYHIINSCNAYIAMCDTTRTTGTNKKYMLSEYAQVKAIRAWVYMQLLYAYGENRIPFYKEPMLTTDDINNFMSNKNHSNITAQVLADELGPELEELEWVEYDSRYGLPQYNNYGDVSSGNGHFVCHSSKCMFPISLVLGDLYLLSAQSREDAATYAKAASHYYKYINSRTCGPLAVDKYHSTALLDERQDYPIYSYDSENIPYTERGEVRSSTEMITCIPSNKGKLEGKVLTDINRLFGFEAEMQTITWDNGDDDGGSSASVSLTRKYERELIPSRGYEALCDSQKYEIYASDLDGNNIKWDNSATLEVLPDVGDARRAWIYSSQGQQFTFRVGDDNLYGKMVTKQNPRSSFTTTYPVIYRKSTVWLRYAEALNRAGFPSYAFAILKTGLCENSDWYPVDPDKEFMEKGEYVPATEKGIKYFKDDGTPNKDTYIVINRVPTKRYDYPITDTLFYYNDVVTGKTLPEGWADDNKMATYAELEEWLTTYFEEEFEAYQEAFLESLDTEEPLDPMESPRDIDKSNVYWRVASQKAIGNEPNPDCGKACYYISRSELKRAANAPYLNFSQQPYLRGSRNQLIYGKDRARLYTQGGRVTERMSSSSNTDATFTIGVHQRGCGFIRWDDPDATDDCPALTRSTYNYVALMQKLIGEAVGKEVSEDEIYSGKYDAEVMDAVEDLIIDEMGLELAFEGTRFSDLYRVAQRRGASYLADRVAKRHTGEVDSKLRSWLMNKDHWFLPIPKD